MVLAPSACLEEGTTGWQANCEKLRIGLPTEKGQKWSSVVADTQV